MHMQTCIASSWRGADAGLWPVVLCAGVRACAGAAERLRT